MNYLTKLSRRLITLFKTDSLFRNAVFLTTSTAVMSVLGFGFWLFVAHLYSPSETGIAAALISITALISNLSMLGFNSGLIRFLPESKDQSGDINAASVTVVAATIVATTVYLILQNHFGVSLAFFAHHLWAWPLFLFLMVAISLNSLTDNVFIANRQAEYHTITYAVFGVVKLILPVLLIALGALGIFTAYVSAVVVSLALSYYFMWRSRDYKLLARPNWKMISETRQYAGSNYIGTILAGLPVQLMPALIIAKIGSAQAAFFALAWTMVNLLYVVPTSFAQSLLAESSHNPARQKNHMFQVIKFLTIILTPLIVLAVFIAPYLLKVFGNQYSMGSTKIFQILAAGTFFVAINALANTRLNVRRHSNGIIVTQLTVAIVTIGLTPLLLRYGLVGVGLAIVAGNIASNIVHLIYYLGDKPTDFKSQLILPNQPFDHAVLKEILRPYGIEAFSYQELTQNTLNQTFAITQGSRRHVLRIYNGNKDNIERIFRELDFTAYLQKYRIPVPRIIANQAGRLLTEADINGRMLRYVLMEFENGHHPNQYSHELLTNMASMQASIHAHGVKYARTAPVIMLAATKEQTLKQRLTFFHLTPRGYSHFDYDGSNILVVGNQIKCILDFEGMRYDSLVVCIFYTLMRLYEETQDKQDLESYLQSYQQVRKLRLSERLIIRSALMVKLKSPKLLTLSF